MDKPKPYVYRIKADNYQVMVERANPTIFPVYWHILQTLDSYNSTPGDDVYKDHVFINGQVAEKHIKYLLQKQKDDFEKYREWLSSEIERTASEAAAKKEAEGKLADWKKVNLHGKTFSN